MSPVNLAMLFQHMMRWAWTDFQRAYWVIDICVNQALDERSLRGSLLEYSRLRLLFASLQCPREHASLLRALSKHPFQVHVHLCVRRVSKHFVLIQRSVIEALISIAF